MRFFLDSKNLENFDRQQFEGKNKKNRFLKKCTFPGSLSRNFYDYIFYKTWISSNKKGEAYFIRSENNTLAKILIFADRGIIYDRNKEELAWNKKGRVMN